MSSGSFEPPLVLPLGFTMGGETIYAQVSFSVPLRRGLLLRLARQLSRLGPVLDEEITCMGETDSGAALLEDAS